MSPKRKTKSPKPKAQKSRTIRIPGNTDNIVAISSRGSFDETIQ